jgi:hypothetical protein
LNIKKTDSGNSNPIPKFSNFTCNDVSSGTGETLQTSDGKNIACSELFAFRSLLEKLVCVKQEDSTWTWDHENGLFLIQAPNNVIEQYVGILTRELGESLCLPLEHAAIIVDLRPWKSDADKTSMRIGFEGNHIPDKLYGHTGLENLVNLHFIFRPDDSPDMIKALTLFRSLCVKIDVTLENKCEWMWEKHWKADGLAFAVVKTYLWSDKSAVVEGEIERFNNALEIQNAGLLIDFSKYNRGSSFNLRISLNGLKNNLRKDTRILDVFDTHFSGSIY